MAVTAQVKIDRSKAPKPAPAPKIQIADPATFTLPNGLKVFVVQNTKLPRVSATLTIDRESILEGDKAGMVSMAGSLLTRGTAKRTKAELDEAVDFLGGDLSGSATSVRVSSLTANFPKLMEIMAEVALQPSFSAEELEKIRKQTLTGLQQAKDNPNAISTNVANKLLYGANHPYGENQTEKTVKNVTIDDIKKYYNTYWKPNIAYLVFVGDIAPVQAKAMAEKYFSGWKKGEVSRPVYQQPKAPAKTYVAIIDRPASVQSVIKLVAPIDLKPGAANAIPADVMNEILGGSSSGRLYSNLREKHGFTYGAYSSVDADKLVGEFRASASVRTEKTDSAVGEFLNEFNRLRKEAVTADEISRIKNYMSGSFARSLEQPGTIAAFALNIARYNLPKDYYRNYLTNLSKVGIPDVQLMATTYVQPERMHIVIVGNAKGITGMEKYGEVKYFDVNGNEIEKPAAKKVDVSITAESVLKKAIDAMGGEKAIAAIKDITIDAAVNIQGNELGASQQVIVGNAYSYALLYQGMALQKEMVKNGEYSRSLQGNSQPVDEKTKEELNEKAAYFTESYMLQHDYKFKVSGIEAVDGKDAYAIEITTPTGRNITNYYDVQSGLKVKSVTTRDMGGAPTTVQTLYKDYQPKGGVKIATKVSVDLGRFVQDIELKDVKINTGLKADDIK